MSITNPNYGLQLDANTIVLYKSIAEIGGDPVDGTSFVDSAGNYHPIRFSGSVGYGPNPVNGPLGPQGILEDNPNFALGFRYNYPNTGGRPSDGRIQTAAAIDSAFNDALRLNPFTQQVMFYYDPVDLTRDCYLIGGQGSPTSTSHGEDRLARLYVDVSDGETFYAAFEGGDLYTAVRLDGLVPETGKWHVITVAYDPAGSGYAIDAWLHKIDAGAVSLISSHSEADSGTKPNATSGTTAAYGVGHLTVGTSTLEWQGAIAFARIVKAGLDATAAATQAEELLTTGELDSEVTTNDLIRWEFNETPGWIDEGPLGLHGWEYDGTVDFVSTGDDNKRHIDIVGSGGRARFNSFGVSSSSTAANRVPNTTQPTLMNAAFSGYTKLESFFNNDVLTVPEYTLQQVGVWGGSGSSVVKLIEWQHSGETSQNNFLFRINLNPTTGDIEWFSEYGSGTNVVVSNLVTAGPISEDVLQQTMLITTRVGEKPGFPGTQRFRVSINDQIDIISGDLDGVPTDGRWGHGINHMWPDAGLYQEFKATFGEITDQQIEDDFERLGDREGPIVECEPCITALSIEELEILSANTLLLTFSAPLSTNEANYLADSYSSMTLTVRSVMPPLDEVSPRELILVTDPLQVGEEYAIAGVGLESADGNTHDTEAIEFTGRKTKLDKVLSGTQILYDASMDSTFRQILTAIHREDDKIGGTENI